jgi:hypothetical protein
MATVLVNTIPGRQGEALALDIIDHGTYTANRDNFLDALPLYLGWRKLQGAP